MVRFYQKHFCHQYPGALMTLVVIGVWLRFAAVAARLQGQRLWVRGWQWAFGPRSGRAQWLATTSRKMPLEDAIMPIVTSTRPLTS
jgi:hypothetical protein